MTTLTSNAINYEKAALKTPIVFLDNDALSFPIPILSDQLDDEGLSSGIDILVGKSSRSRKSTLNF